MDTQDDERDLAQEHADLMEMQAEHEYRAEDDPYSRVFEPDDPVKEQEFADAGLPYKVIPARARTEELHRTLNRRLKDQPMSIFGDRVRLAVLQCVPGNRCGFPTCATCGLAQRDKLADDLIPVVKAWKARFGDHRVSFVSVDGEICQVPEVAQTMEKFRRRFENTFKNNLGGCEVVGEYELAVTEHSELPIKKPKPMKIRKHKSRLPDLMVGSVVTEFGDAWVYHRDIHRGRRGRNGLFIRTTDGLRVSILRVKHWLSNRDGKFQVSTKLDWDGKHRVRHKVDPAGTDQGELGSISTDNRLPPAKPGIKVHAHVVVVHPDIDRKELERILKRTFASKGAVCVTGIEDRVIWGELRDGVVQVCRYIFDKSSAVKGSKRRDYDAEKNPRGIDASLQAMAFDAYATWKKGSRRRFKIHHGDVGM